MLGKMSVLKSSKDRQFESNKRHFLFTSLLTTNHPPNYSKFFYKLYPRTSASYTYPPNIVSWYNQVHKNEHTGSRIQAYWVKLNRASVTPCVQTCKLRFMLTLRLGFWCCCVIIMYNIDGFRVPILRGGSHRPDSHQHSFLPRTNICHRHLPHSLETNS